MSLDVLALVVEIYAPAIMFGVAAFVVGGVFIAAAIPFLFIVRLSFPKI